MALPSPMPMSPGPQFWLSAGPSVPVQAMLVPGSPHGHGPIPKGATLLVLHADKSSFALFALACAPAQIFSKHEIALKWY